MIMNVKLTSEKAKMPTRAYSQDAGLDVYSIEDAYIPSGGYRVVDTGVCVEIPEGMYIRVASKSGLMTSKGIFTDGTIDEGYTGSIKVCLFNSGIRAVEIKAGDKVAQLIVMRCEKPNLVLTDVFAESERGEDGFGSTGR